MMQLRDILLGCLIVLVLPERLFNKIEKLIKVMWLQMKSYTIIL